MEGTVTRITKVSSKSKAKLYIKEKTNTKDIEDELNLF